MKRFEKKILLLTLLSFVIISCQIEKVETTKKIEFLQEKTLAINEEKTSNIKNSGNVFKHFQDQEYLYQDTTGNFLEGYWKNEDLWMKWGNTIWSDSSKFHDLFDEEYGISVIYKLWSNENFISLLRGCGSPCHQEIIFPFKQELNQYTIEKIYTFRELGTSLAEEKNILLCWHLNEKDQHYVVVHDLITDKVQKNNFEEISENENGWYSGAFGYLPSVIDTIIYSEDEIQIIQNGENKINKKIIQLEK